MTVPRNERFGRRAALAAIATGVAGSLAGCSLRPSFPDADVVAGPDGEAVFDPASLTVSAGETATWGFASTGHNVCCRPDDAEAATLPDSADPFASYAPDERPEGSLVPRGETYEHTFETTGRYVYVCLPHAARGMAGTVRVE